MLNFLLVNKTSIIYSKPFSRLIHIPNNIYKDKLKDDHYFLIIADVNFIEGGFNIYILKQFYQNSIIVKTD